MQLTDFDLQRPRRKESEEKFTQVPGGGGYSRQFRIGVCRQGSQTLTLFKGRKSRIDTLLKAQNQEMPPYIRETT